MSDLAELSRQMASCRQCSLAERRTRVVPGEGPEDASLVFIGEAPGYHEDQQGRPFVGQAGMLLEQLLASIGLRRQQVYICNVIKCRPPGNRDPLPDEIQACAGWLDRQLALLKPHVLVTLGRYSMARYFPGETISKIHGQPRRREGVIYFPCYHPAAALHQPRFLDAIKADFLKLPPLLAEAEKAAPGPEPEEPEKKEEAPPKQLSLF